jgi:hypothetical protein
MREDLALALALRTVGDRVPTGDADLTWAALEPRLADQARTPSVADRSRKVGTTLKIVAACAASVIAIAGVSLAAEPGSLLYPVKRASEGAITTLVHHSGELRLQLARERLSDLVYSLRSGSPSQAPPLAVALAQERSQAISLGASSTEVARLDTQIRSVVPSALTSAPAAISHEVWSALAAVLPPEPSVTPTPGPNGGDSGGASGGSGGSQGGSGSVSGSTGGTSGGSTEGSGGGSGTGGSNDGGTLSGDGGTQSGGGSGDGGTSGGGTSGGGGSGDGGTSGGSGSGSGD